MGFPQHWLLSFGGQLVSGADIWNNGIRFAVDGGGSPGVVDETAMVEEMATTIAAAFALAPGSGGLGYSSSCTLEWVKFNEINALGGYADETTTHVHEFATPVVGNGSGGGFLQVAMAVSWGTAAARGYASKGRIFVPMPAVGLQAGTGKFAQTVTQQIATNWATLIDELNNQPGIDQTGIVAAVVSKVPASGLARAITSVRVGDVPDTMRSRRNALNEAYVTAAVPAGA